LGAEGFLIPVVFVGAALAVIFEFPVWAWGVAPGALLLAVDLAGGRAVSAHFRYALGTRWCFGKSFDFLVERTRV